MTPTRIRHWEKAIDDALEGWSLERAEQLAADYLSEAGQTMFDRHQVDRAPGFRAAVAAAQVALLAGRPGQAARLLAPLTPFAASPSTSSGAQVRLLLSEALARQGQRAGAISLLDEVPETQLNENLDQRLRALRIRLCLGATVDEEEIIHCCEELSNRGRRESEAILWCDMGRSLYESGDLARAEECWNRAEQRSRGSGVQPVHADALLQLGRLEHLLGRFGPALGHFDRAKQHGLPVQVLEARLRRLLVLLEHDQRNAVRAEADELLANLLAAITEELQPLTRFVLGLVDGLGCADLSVEARAYLLAAQGRDDEARALYTEALQSAQGPERRARLSLALGLLSGEADVERWLRQAEQMARHLDLPEVLCRSLLARGEMIAEQSDGEEEARGLFEEVVILSEMQSSGVGPFLGAGYRRQRRSVLRHLLESSCRRGDPAAVFRYQERERGRLLLEWQARSRNRDEGPLFERPEWRRLSSDLADNESRLKSSSAETRPTLRREREEMLTKRDQLFERHLLERDRPGSVVPPVAELKELSGCLPADTLYVAPVLARDGVYILGVVHGGTGQLVRSSGASSEVIEQVEDFDDELMAQLRSYGGGRKPGAEERARIDRKLDQVGNGPLGQGLLGLLHEHQPRRIIWAPDAELYGLPIHALRLGGHYLIEMVDVVWAFGGAVIVNQHRTRRHRRGAWRTTLAVAEASSVLPAAERESSGVAAAFFRGRRLTGPEATRSRVLDELKKARIVHFACHAEFDPARPLGACLRLPSGESLYAQEWLEEPVLGLSLVTLSACRAAEVAPLAGGEVFGQVTGLLAGGVRAVAAGLWPVADEETPPLMWSFYRHLMRESIATSLANAQRESLNQGDSSPLFWAAFALFGDGDSIPARSGLWRWLAAWRQRRHARTYTSWEVSTGVR
jgi:tetratricopeptide (TPR) repeat protein